MKFSVSRQAASAEQSFGGLARDERERGAFRGNFNSLGFFHLTLSLVFQDRCLSFRKERRSIPLIIEFFKRHGDGFAGRTSFFV